MGISLSYSNVLASLVATSLSNRDKNHLDLEAITQLSSVWALGTQGARGKSKLMALKTKPAPATGSLPTTNTKEKEELQ